jgi:hypothetical protein
MDYRMMHNERCFEGMKSSAAVTYWRIQMITLNCDQAGST